MSNRAEGGHRVAMLSPCFWPEVQRGGERIIRDLATGLIARGHRPMLITSHPGPRSRTVEDGLPIVRNPRPPMGRLVRRGYEDYLTHVPLSYLELTASKPDLAHAWFPTDATAAVRWAARTGRPAMFTNLGIPDHGYLVSRRGRARRMAEVAHRCDAVVAVSHAAANAFRHWLGVEADVIHPGVDLSTFTPGAERAAVPTIVCMAPADIARKRVPLLLEAFKAVRRSRPDARLRLGAPARTKVSGEGIDATPEPPDPSRLASVYREAWVSVLPSVGEALGLVLVEALACGTPVVGSRLDGIPEVIDRDEIGRLFDGDDPAALATALLEALELADSNGTAEACRARAEEFSVDRATQAYEHIYRELLER